MTKTAKRRPRKAQAPRKAGPIPGRFVPRKGRKRCFKLLRAERVSDHGGKLTWKPRQWQQADPKYRCVVACTSSALHAYKSRTQLRREAFGHVSPWAVWVWEAEYAGPFDPYSHDKVGARYMRILRPVGWLLEDVNGDLQIQRKPTVTWNEFR